MAIGGVLGIELGSFWSRLIFALVLIVIGFIIGTAASALLKHLSKKAELHKARSYQFIKLVITVIAWSIYLLFINLALVELEIPILTNWLSSILLVIPSLTGALILIVAGFTIATYLRSIIEESKIPEYETLSQIFWYFVLYVFTVFALKTALITVDTKTTNYLIIVLTAIVGLSLAYNKFREK
jgi:hypothetical protein